MGKSIEVGAKTTIQEKAQELYDIMVANEINVSEVATEVLGIYVETFWGWREGRAGDSKSTHVLLLTVTNLILNLIEQREDFPNMSGNKYGRRRANAEEVIRAYNEQYQV
jgi:hypothetical protein